MKKTNLCITAILCTQIMLAQTIDIILAKDVSGSTPQETVPFNAKEVFLDIIKPLNLIQSKHAVNLTVCSIGETGHPRYFSAYLEQYDNSKTSKYERYKQVKKFIAQAYMCIDKIASKKSEETSSNIYRNLHHIANVGFKQDSSKRFLAIWSDFVENSPVDSWYDKYSKNPSSLLKNYEDIVKRFESDLSWKKKSTNTNAYLISKGYSELSIMGSRFFQKYLTNKGMDTEIKASF